MRKFHFSSICNVLPCELRLFWYSTRVLNRHLANKLPTCGRQSADCWQKICVKGGKRQLADCRSTVVRLSADSFLGELFFIFSQAYKMLLSKQWVLQYRIYPCISRPFKTSKSVQKIALDLYMGQKPRTKKLRDKLA